MNRPLLLLATAAILAGAVLSLRAADPDDETPPPAFDKDAAARRRFNDPNLKTRNFTFHYGGARPSAKFIRETKPITIGVEDDVPAIRPMLVTLNLKDAAPLDAVTALAKQANLKIDVMPAGYFGNKDLPKINLSLDKQPLMEAILQFACQTGTRLDRGNTPDRLHFIEGESDKASGTWCVAGPIAFVLNRVENTIALDKLDPTAGRSGTVMSMEMFSEPRVRVLAYPAKFEIEIIQDERGNSLVPKAPAVPRASLLQQVGTQLMIPLTIPEGAGNKIKIFRACGRFTIQTEGAKLEFPLGDNSSEQKAGPFTVETSALKSGQNQWSATVKIKRNNCDEKTWIKLTSGSNIIMQNARPTATSTDGKILTNWGGNIVETQDDTCTLTCSWFRDPNNPTPPATLNFNVPTNVQDIIVPFVFRDLLLP